MTAVLVILLTVNPGGTSWKIVLHWKDSAPPPSPAPHLRRGSKNKQEQAKATSPHPLLSKDGE